MAGYLLIPAVLSALLLLAAFSIWMERRLLALWQERLGPNRVGPFGLLQVAADLIKILTKEDWVAPFAARPLFVLAPVVTVVTVLLAFAAVPFAPGLGIAEMNLGILFVLAMTSLGVYSQVLGGWASNSKYALLGGMRGAAQLISYEVFLGLALLGVVMLAGSFDLREVVEAQRGGWFFLPQLPGLVLFLIAGVAEAHRLPFDLPEAEQELVAGYHTEYSGMKFGLFFLGEYLGVLLIGALVTTLFLGGWLGPLLPGPVWFVMKTLLVAAFIFLLRAALPRPRYDQLMSLAWKVMLPLALLNVLVTGAVLLWRLPQG